MPEEPRRQVGIDDEIPVRYGRFALDSQDMIMARAGGVVFTSKLIDHCGCGDWTPALLELFEPGDYHVRAHVATLR
jgi:hypothetical protein